jgi:hypothetical protein
MAGPTWFGLIQKITDARKRAQRDVPVEEVTVSIKGKVM